MKPVVKNQEVIIHGHVVFSLLKYNNLIYTF